MSLYVPGSAGGFVHTGAEELDRKLRAGDGIVWSGDPRLELRMGILEETRRGVKTGRVARRYEVWRHTEQGEDVMIGHWRMDEFHLILHDVARMKAAVEGRAPTAETIIDTENAKIERAAHDKYRDAMGEMLSHAASIKAERSEGKNTFYQVGGFRDDSE